MLNVIGKYFKENYAHYIFDVSVIIKGIDGFLEIIAGTILFFIKPTEIISIVRFLTFGELVEDPKDIIANYLLNASHHFSINFQFFIAVYLFIHGVIKIIIIVGLLKNKFWAYPIGIIVFSIFVLYQIYQYTYSHSVGLIFLTIFDVFIILLIWHKYNSIIAYKK